MVGEVNLCATRLAWRQEDAHSALWIIWEAGTNCAYGSRSRELYRVGAGDLAGCRRQADGENRKEE